MQAVILAGGFGTRISEETGVKPKPMVEIGDEPILWHIMKIYSTYGINDFVICLGYKGSIIKAFFANYLINNSDVTFDYRKNDMKIHDNGSEPWTVTLVETGQKSMTGGRLKRVRQYINDETFCMTYGDGVSDIDIGALLKFHKEQGVLATLTAVQPPGRFGAFSLEHEQIRVNTFMEKPQGDGAWINGGFFVLEPEVFDYIDGDNTVWEKEPLENLAKNDKLAAYRHKGFWQPMDTLRDKKYLESLYESGQAPWIKW
ncbi:MAG: glucose-1-phosphate cytidylyltransferase [Desulfobacteraceae bacterium]|nr:glucose-1-phosphate cytidylyltransferase [Desulfobacteraceae bacterium]